MRSLNGPPSRSWRGSPFAIGHTQRFGWLTSRLPFELSHSAGATNAVPERCAPLHSSPSTKPLPRRPPAQLSLRRSEDASTVSFCRTLRRQAVRLQVKSLTSRQRSPRCTPHARRRDAAQDSSSTNQTATCTTQWLAENVPTQRRREASPSTSAPHEPRCTDPPRTKTFNVASPEEDRWKP